MDQTHKSNNSKCADTGRALVHIPAATTWRRSGPAVLFSAAPLRSAQARPEPRPQHPSHRAAFTTLCHPLHPISRTQREQKAIPAPPSWWAGRGPGPGPGSTEHRGLPPHQGEPHQVPGIPVPCCHDWPCSVCTSGRLLKSNSCFVTIAFQRDCLIFPGL